MTEPIAAEDAVLPGSGTVLPSAPQYLAGDLSPRERERLLQVQLKEQRAAADLKARREKAAADREEEQARFKQREQQKADRDKRRRDKKADKKADRADAVRDATEWIDEHQGHLMLAVLIAVPMLLGWEGMSSFGSHYWGPLGVALPVVSETGMWYFDFSIARARRQAEEAGGKAVVWPRYIGMFFFAALCAGLNFLHGDLGPISGKAKPGFGSGLVYAPVSVSGLVAHQIEILSSRVKVATKKPSRQKVAKVVVIKWPWQVAKEVAGPAGGGGGRSGGGSGAPAGRGSGAANGSNQNSSGGFNLGSQGNGNGGGNNPPGNQDNLARGEKGKLMREFWDQCIREGRIPTAADMNSEAGNERGASLGGNNRRKWIQEPEAKKILEKLENPALAGAGKGQTR